MPQPNWTHGGITLVTIWCVFHVAYTTLITHTGVERHNANKSRPTRNRHLVRLSLIFRWASLAMSVHRRCHCALCLQHTTLPQQTPLRNSPSRSFCSCVTLNTPSGAQFHSDFMKTPVKHRPPATQGTRWQRSSLLPSSSSVASSPDPPAASPPQLHTTSGCIYSGFPTQCRLRRCYHPTPAHSVLSWVRLLR